MRRSGRRAAPHHTGHRRCPRRRPRPPRRPFPPQAAAEDAAGTASAAALAAHAAGSSSTARASAHALHGWRTRRGAALDIVGLPGTEHLSARERELCASARILPAHYLSLKDVIMRDAAANGFISRQDVSGRARAAAGAGDAAGAAAGRRGASWLLPRA